VRRGEAGEGGAEEEGEAEERVPVRKGLKNRQTAATSRQAAKKP